MVQKVLDEEIDPRAEPARFCCASLRSVRTRALLELMATPPRDGSNRTYLSQMLDSTQMTDFEKRPAQTATGRGSEGRVYERGHSGARGPRPSLHT